MAHAPLKRLLIRSPNAQRRKRETGNYWDSHPVDSNDVRRLSDVHLYCLDERHEDS